VRENGITKLGEASLLPTSGANSAARSVSTLRVVSFRERGLTFPTIQFNMLDGSCQEDITIDTVSCLAYNLGKAR